MDGREQVCPACGQAVESVVRRHKTLGAWVPVWGPGACRNPECAEYAGAPRARERSPSRPPPLRSRRPHSSPPESGPPESGPPESAS
ncbi:hypothetical protein AB0958_01895 [Streptomyces sp. NPDC006655]|uniref:hypothetical protein n=1 Tax=Streptomyces sp. NPDC006655 TaxID=3156898 RepID=UPI0034539140